MITRARVIRFLIQSVSMRRYVFYGALLGSNIFAIQLGQLFVVPQDFGVEPVNKQIIASPQKMTAIKLEETKQRKAKKSLGDFKDDRNKKN